MAAHGVGREPDCRRIPTYLFPSLGQPTEHGPTWISPSEVKPTSYSASVSQRPAFSRMSVSLRGAGGGDGHFSRPPVLSRGGPYSTHKARMRSRSRDSRTTHPGTNLPALAPSGSPAQCQAAPQRHPPTCPAPAAPACQSWRPPLRRQPPPAGCAWPCRQSRRPRAGRRPAAGGRSTQPARLLGSRPGSITALICARCTRSACTAQPGTTSQARERVLRGDPSSDAGASSRAGRTSTLCWRTPSACATAFCTASMNCEAVCTLMQPPSSGMAKAFCNAGGQGRHSQRGCCFLQRERLAQRQGLEQVGPLLAAH